MITAVVVAGGAGLRMGGAHGIRKQYLELDGRPVLARALDPFLSHPRVGAVVAVLPREDVESPPGWIRALPAILVAGGAERSESVRNGVLAAPTGTDVVLIHDAARPLVTAALIDRVIDATGADPAVIPALRATDTLKEVERQTVVATLDRERIWLAQTPQGFHLEPLVAAHRRAQVEGWRVTDDASLLERAGVAVRVVEGDPRNIKLTRPLDLVIARALLRATPDEEPSREGEDTHAE